MKIKYFDFHGGGGEGGDFLVESFGDALVHGGSAGHDDVLVEVFADVDVGLHDRFISQFVNSVELFPDHFRVEKHFRASESLVAHVQSSPVGQFVHLLIIITNELL
jgi:hypothetical protein